MQKNIDKFILRVINYSNIKRINKLINIPDDDFKRFAGVFMNLPMHVMFNTTYWCDNECPHCHYNCSTSHYLHKIIPEQDIEYFLSEFEKTNTPIDSSFFGWRNNIY